MKRRPLIRQIPRPPKVGDTLEFLYNGRRTRGTIVGWRPAVHQAGKWQPGRWMVYRWHGGHYEVSPEAVRRIVG